jgi:hypothetical protein
LAIGPEAPAFTSQAFSLGVTVTPVVSAAVTIALILSAYCGGVFFAGVDGRGPVLLSPELPIEPAITSCKCSLGSTFGASDLRDADRKYVVNPNEISATMTMIATAASDLCLLIIYVPFK